MEKLWGFCEGNRADDVDLLGFCCFGGDFVTVGLWKKCGMLGVISEFAGSLAPREI